MNQRHFVKELFEDVGTAILFVGVGYWMLAKGAYEYVADKLMKGERTGGTDQGRCEGNDQSKDKRS